MQKQEWTSPEKRGGKPAQKKQIKPGIGGWLILPAVKVVLSPLVFGYYLLIMAVLFFEVWPQPGASVEKLWQLGLAVVVALAGFIVYVFTAWAFFRKKSFVPKLMIFLLLIELAIPMTRFLSAVYQAPPDISFTDILLDSKLIIYILGVGVWVRYFQVSKRVKLTFVN